MATLAPAPPPAANQDGFVPLASGILRFLNKSHLDLFLWNSKVGRQVLFRQADTPLEESQIDELVARCGDYLYVRTTDFEDVCACMFSTLDDVTHDEQITPPERFALLQTALSFEVDKRLDATRPNDYLKLARHVGDLIGKLVGENQILPSNLFRIAKHDAATFAHVTNVAGYATTLAQALGITNADDLDEIVVGAMLHDIGKRHIPKRVLTKASRLSNEERELMRAHPLLGYEELAHSPEVTHAQRMMIYQHHEHVDGSGYPVKVLGDEIHPWAKLVAVVDVFDALTGWRPYRRAMKVREAIEFIAERAGEQFDKEIAECWISTMNAK